MVLINDRIKMRKQIKKYGGSLVIVLDKEDLDWYSLSQGDWVDIGNPIKLTKEEVRSGEIDEMLDRKGIR